MSDQPGSPGNRIRIRICDLRQLFNSMDPSPFLERDLDRDAEDFIVDWARELSFRAPIAIEVQITGPAAGPEALEMAKEALKAHFARAAHAEALALHRLLRDGRLSLAIGVLFLAACLGLSTLAPAHLREPLARLASESLIIGGWVAMWRPLEIFLYRWWPLARERRMLGRLAEAEITLTEGDPCVRPA
jgi:hypothetical protein